MTTPTTTVRTTTGRVRACTTWIGRVLSALDSGGCAVKNGIDGNGLALLDLTVRYTVNLPGAGTQSIGFYFDVYNVLNKDNFGNPSGERLDDNFLVPVVAGRPREAQVGVRYTF